MLTEFLGNIISKYAMKEEVLDLDKIWKQLKYSNLMDSELDENAFTTASPAFKVPIAANR